MSIWAKVIPRVKRGLLLALLGCCLMIAGAFGALVNAKAVQPPVESSIVFLTVAAEALWWTFFLGWSLTLAGVGLIWWGKRSESIDAS